MKPEALPSIKYDGDEVDGTASLFKAWESGSTSDIPAPLSVRRPRYRQIIVCIVRHYAAGAGTTVLSIGAGNGFAELALARAGFDVVATDRSHIAVSHCRQKGLRALQYDFPDNPPPVDRTFDVLYCDGVFGHLWSPESGFSLVWRRLRQLGNENSIVFLSNDLAETDAGPTFEVFGQPNARFFRPPVGWFAKDAGLSGLWTLEAESVLLYKRPKGMRRRELLVLKRSH